MPELIIGMTAFQEQLKELELTSQKQVLTAAAKAGALIVRDQARRRAPRDTGDLAGGITMRVSAKQTDVHEATVDVGPDKKQFYGFFQEFGTAHNRKQPFLIPSLEDNRDQITQAMTDEMIQAIERAVR